MGEITQLVPSGAELDLRLAERFWVPCRNGADGLYLDVDLTGEKYTCPDCHGTGKLWPLREPCTQCLGGTHPVRTFLCQGRGWLPDITYDTLEAAWLAKGWLIEVTSDPEDGGDWVMIVSKDGIAGEVYGASGDWGDADNLRGLEAIKVALLRAQDKEE